MVSLVVTLTTHKSDVKENIWAWCNITGSNVVQANASTLYFEEMQLDGRDPSCKMSNEI